MFELNTDEGEEMRQMWLRSRRVHNFMPFDNWHIHSDYSDQNPNVEHAENNKWKALNIERQDCAALENPR